MNNQVFKRNFIKKLTERDVWYQEVSSIQYRTRCPYCGDSSNPNTGHFYIKVNPNDNLPIVYFCFKCPASGVMNAETLSLLGITDSEIMDGISILNKTSERYDSSGITTDIKPMFFDFKLPPQKYSSKIQYIENRIGLRFTKEMVKDARIVSSVKDFLRFNKLDLSNYKKGILDILDRDYVGFLSYGNSHILFRDVTEKQKIPWIKFPIVKESINNRVFYSIRSKDIDIMTTEKITINLAEGIMDILSIAYNLGYIEGLSLNISVGGKYYEKILFMLIDMGFVGSNIHINIFSDNDKDFNKKKGNEDTRIEHYQRVFKDYKYLFGSFTIWYNTIYKDCGVPKDKIILKKEKL